jgi:hypothetical protein
MNIPIVNSRFTFSRENLIKLFLIVAFPINFWALLLWFRDIEFITERTDFNDAIGAGGYVMTFALGEALIIFLAVNLLILLLSKNKEEGKVLAQVTAAFLMLSVWLMFEQALHLFEWAEEGFLWRIQYHLDNLTQYGILAWAMMLLAIIFALVAIHRYESLKKFILSAIDRTILLSGLYLVFNLAGIVIVVIRNV